jgi:hypothetical protein
MEKKQKNVVEFSHPAIHFQRMRVSTEHLSAKHFQKNLSISLIFKIKILQKM